MALLADVAALELALGADLEAARAQLALEWATADCQEYTNQHLFLVADDEHVVTIDRARVSFALPELPVIAVDSIKDADDVELDPDDHWRLGEHGVIHRRGRALWATGDSFTVTYTHGFALIPERIESVCVEVASAYYSAADMMQSAGVRQESYGSRAVTYTGTGLGGAIATALKRLDRYRV